MTTSLQQSSENYFFSISFDNNSPILKMKINSIIAPWTILDILGKQLYFIDDDFRLFDIEDPLNYIKWFDTTNVDTFFLKNIFYFPYIFIFTYNFIPFIHSKLSKS